MTVSWPGCSTLRSYVPASNSDAPARKERVRANNRGFGVTLAGLSQAVEAFLGVVYRPIRNENAWVRVGLAWRSKAEDPAVGRLSLLKAPSGSD
jgi:hypothetical protein